MLEMRPDCEHCGRDLAADESVALICSFECTFCASCNDMHLHGRCPNCGGGLQARPMRVGDALVKFPASDKRKFKAMEKE